MQLQSTGDGVVVGYGKAIYAYVNTMVNYGLQRGMTIYGIVRMNMQIGSYQLTCLF